MALSSKVWCLTFSYHCAYVLWRGELALDFIFFFSFPVSVEFGGHLHIYIKKRRTHFSWIPGFHWLRLASYTF